MPILFLLKYTTNGLEDIISERSKGYARHAEEIKEMTTKELIEFIKFNPAILKRPLTVDDITETIYVGYNKFDLENLL